MVVLNCVLDCKYYIIIAINNYVYRFNKNRRIFVKNKLGESEFIEYCVYPNKTKNTAKLEYDGRYYFMIDGKKICGRQNSKFMWFCGNLIYTKFYIEIFTFEGYVESCYFYDIFNIKYAGVVKMDITKWNNLTQFDMAKTKVAKTIVFSKIPEWANMFIVNGVGYYLEEYYNEDTTFFVLPEYHEFYALDEFGNITINEIVKINGESFPNIKAATIGLFTHAEIFPDRPQDIILTNERCSVRVKYRDKINTFSIKYPGIICVNGIDHVVDFKYYKYSIDGKVRSYPGTLRGFKLRAVKDFPQC